MGYIVKGIVAMKTLDLEQEADRLLGLKRRGRRIAHEYPVLSERQLRRIAETELLLGEERVSAFADCAGSHHREITSQRSPW